MTTAGTHLGQDPQQASQTAEVQLQNSDPRTIRDVSVLVRCAKRKGFGCSKQTVQKHQVFYPEGLSERESSLHFSRTGKNSWHFPPNQTFSWASRSLTALRLESSRDIHMTIPQTLKDHFHVPCEPSPKLESPLKGAQLANTLNVRCPKTHQYSKSDLSRLKSDPRVRCPEFKSQQGKFLNLSNGDRQTLCMPR